MKESHLARSVRVFAVPFERIPELFSGKVRIINMPSGAEISAAQVIPGQKLLGVRVHHHTFSTVPHYEQIPIVTAAFGKVA